MKVSGVLINLFVPGIGTMVVGKIGQGIAQFVIWAVGVAICFSVVGAIIGLPMAIGAWIWSLVSVGSNRRPIQIEITNKDMPRT
jgi:TM2 domain-containing membrane protein YozV